MRQGRGSHQRVVRDAYAVVNLVALLEAAQNGDRVLDRRLAHIHGLEAPLEGGVLLDVLAVLVEGGGTHHVQLAARESGLQRSEEHTSELQSLAYLVCRLLLE